jgi:hypothetical protein
MTASAASATRPAFSRGGALALVAGGFALFLALLWLIGAGEDIGGERGRGQAHAAANGLNGFSGFVRLIEAQGYAVSRSRSAESLRTEGLLVLTPPTYAKPETIAEILEARAAFGPTLVILPKWWAVQPPPQLAANAKGGFRRGWVVLSDTIASDWPAQLPAPYTLQHKLAGGAEERAAGWQGMGLAGRLPSGSVSSAQPKGAHEPLITDAAGRVLALRIPASDSDSTQAPLIVLAEPDLSNNYGLADPARAAAAVALVEALTDERDIDSVTFDMTLNGFGASENLLTLAFRPPFLAATLSLLVALLIVGWRAFMRFGPSAAAAGPDIAFGKRQLIVNGAGLILRARRFGLLGAPYAALAARRIAERLGLARAEPAAIDAALARRLPQDEPFTHHTARIETARKPAEILAAAQALDALTTRLSQGQSTTGTKTR